MGLSVCGMATGKGHSNVRFPGTTPASEGTYEPQVLGIAPSIYLKFAESSGTSFADSSGNGRNATLSGSGATLGATSLVSGVGAGNAALDLGGSAHVVIPHATADTALSLPSDWESLVVANPGDSPLDLLDGFRFIAGTDISIRFKINAMPTGTDRAVIFSKSSADAVTAAASYASTHPVAATSTVNGGSFDAYFDANGAVHVEVRSFRGRLCRISTPASAVALDGTYHLNVQLSYDGVTAWLDGAQFEDGYANPLHVFGLCANIRGLVFRNNFDWRIGASGWGGTADITVDEFAVFNKAPSAALSQANVNTLAQQGSTPAALAHPVWGALSVNAASFGTIQEAVDTVNASGGGTVLISAGTYAPSGGGITMKSRVRLKANGGTVNINGWCRTAQLSPTSLGTGSGDFLTGAKTLTVTNGAAIGDLVKVMGTAGNPSPMRHDRRWNGASEGNDENVPDGQAFEIEERTGSDMTFVGVGCPYDFASGSRASITVVTPNKWIGLEGDIRFSAAGQAVAFYRTVNARVVGIRATNTHASTQQALVFWWDSLGCWCRDVTIVQADEPDLTADNDGFNAYFGATDCVFHSCTCQEGRHCADCASNANFGPCYRNEWHNLTWINQTSRDGPSRGAYGAHGMCTDNIYWCIETEYGGPAVQGWKPDARWAICNTSDASGGGQVSINDGGSGIYLRDTYVIDPAEWFVAFEDPVSVDNCHFENVNHSEAPTSQHSGINYGTGALANTDTNVDTRSASWTAV